jgi:HEAT repeat protein
MTDRCGMRFAKGCSMRKGLCVVLSIAVFVLFFNDRAIPDDKGVEVEKLMKELDDDDFETREKATEKLVQLWEDETARKSIDEALAKGKQTGSSEVKYRCESIEARVEFFRRFNESVLSDLGIPELKRFQDADEATALTIFEKCMLNADTQKKYGFQEKSQQAVLAECTAGKLKSDPGKLRFLDFIDGQTLKGCARGVAMFLKDQNGSMRGRAASVLGVRLKDREYVENIAALLQDTDDSARAEAVWALCSLRAKEYAEDIGKMMGTETSDQVKQRALTGLGELRSSEWAKVAAGLLRDPSWIVRAEAVKHLGSVAPEEYSKELTDMLKDKDHWPRIYAGYALRRLGGKHVEGIEKMLDDMSARLKTEADDDEMLGALITICALDDSRKRVKDVAERLKDESALVRRQAIGVLGHSWKIGEYAGEIASMLGDGDAQVRASAASTLGLLCASKYAKEVSTLLQDADAWARGRAAETLAMFGAKEYAGEIAKLLKDVESQARGCAVWALTELDGRELGRVPNIGGNWLQRDRS